MNKWMIIGLWLAAGPVWGVVPQQITYQGTLKQAGVAANGSYTMTFRLTDSLGLTQYWSSTPMTVEVTQGLFSVALSPSGMDWANVTPYIEVNVNGQVLLPREAVNATAYALECGSIAGMIAMFADSCPAGWTRFSDLDGRFPMGGASYGAVGGSNSHQHTLLEGAQSAGDGPMTVGADANGNIGAYPGGHNYGFRPIKDITTNVSHLPPYLTMVFCRKQ